MHANTHTLLCCKPILNGIKYDGFTYVYYILNPLKNEMTLHCTAVSNYGTPNMIIKTSLSYRRLPSCKAYKYTVRTSHLIECAFSARTVAECYMGNQSLCVVLNMGNT